VKSPKKSKIFNDKSKNFVKLPEKKSIFSEICPEKLIFVKLPQKIRNFSESLIEKQNFLEIA